MKLDLTQVNPRFKFSSTKKNRRSDSSIRRWHSSCSTNTATTISDDASNSGRTGTTSSHSSYCHPCHGSNLFDTDSSCHSSMTSPTSMLLFTTSPSSNDTAAAITNHGEDPSSCNKNNIPSSYCSEPLRPDTPPLPLPPPPPQLILPEFFDDETNEGNFKSRGGGATPKRRKLELCQSTLKGVTCPFGKMCNFAHHTSELELTTLRQRAKAGIIDIHTYRTRPCIDYVMTGSW
jgi:hypothetical protein